MKVSIITVSYNSASTIRETIESVRRQDYPDIEHVIIDGGSVDETMKIVDEYNDHIACSVSEPDKGIYDAMNKGLSHASGRIIGFLNADDCLAGPSVIARMVEKMNIPGTQAVYGDLQYVDRFNMTKAVRYWKAGPYVPGSFRKGWVPPHPTFYCRSEVYQQLGGYRDDFQVAADFELMLRLIEKNRIAIQYLPALIVNMRTGGTANRLTGMIRGNREILRSFRLNGMKVSPLFFICKPVTRMMQLWKNRSRVE